MAMDTDHALLIITPDPRELGASVPLNQDVPTPMGRN